MGDTQQNFYCSGAASQFGTELDWCLVNLGYVQLSLLALQWVVAPYYCTFKL